MPISEQDQRFVAAQLGRVPRSIVEVAWRCPCGKPGVVKTAPRLDNGTPFPTTYYLTCQRATAGCSALEANQVMVEMSERLAADPELAAAYQRSHEAYLADRAELGDVPEIANVSAGGMPDRVKCLHALVGHALAAGPGVNPFGDEALAMLGEFWRRPCLEQRVAAIDCGTNSIRMLVLAEGEPPRELVRRLELVRLGQGVDATGEFHPDALVRTFAACDDYAAQLAELGCSNIRFVATSAARDARNREEFFRGVQERLGVQVEIISGEEEADLSFTGAISGVEVVGQALVFDIGGGSTELVVGDAQGQINRAVSLDVGAVRVTERFFKHNPPSSEEIAAARAFVDELLDHSGIDFEHVDVAIGVGGTVTSMGAAALELQSYDRAKVHSSVLTLERIKSLSEEWLASTLAQMVARPCMHPLRAEVLPAGSLICERIVARVPSRQVTVSENDILDGIANQLLAEAQLS